MPTQQDVSDHYTHGDLGAAIRSGIESLGKAVISVTVDDLAPVDEFHIGGRQASEDFLGQLDRSPGKHVLDIGCGLGSSAFVASRYGCRVTGIDLTPEYVETAKVLCRWAGLDSSISCQACAQYLCDGAFDAS
jgi:cyclopropane fatty-acyl-phospholipid synthase-like methyltransferase